MEGRQQGGPHQSRFRLSDFRVHIGNLHGVGGYTHACGESSLSSRGSMGAHGGNEINMPRSPHCRVVRIKNCTAVIHIQRGCRVIVTQLKFLEEDMVEVNFLHATAHGHSLALETRHRHRLRPRRSFGGPTLLRHPMFLSCFTLSKDFLRYRSPDRSAPKRIETFRSEERIPLP